MKVTIITVSYNSAKTIEKTILSVINQSYENIEYIIIDGASSDDTLKIINKYQDKITKLISEKDNGIYDAMNKGIEASSGDYLIFLNSDDCFNDNDVIKNFVMIAQKNKKELYYGDLKVYNPSNQSFSIKKHNFINKIFLMKNTPSQPATFYKKDVFEKYGNFRIDYKIVSDQEWFLRAFLKSKISAEYLNFIVTVFSTGGISSEEANIQHNIERKKMFDEYFTAFEQKSYGFLSKYLRGLIKNQFSSFFLNLIFKYEF